MIRRAIALSLLAHVALLGAIAWRWSSRPTEPGLRISAPLGEVFAKPQAKAKLPARPAANPVDLAGEVAERASPAPGVPDGEAHPIGEIHPDYPAMSRKLGEEGEAAFLLQLAADGRVEEARLVQSTGHSRLDEAARAALLQARFVSNGKSALRHFRVEFRLR